MKVKSKFNTGDVVWFMRLNKLMSQKITGIHIDVEGYDAKNPVSYVKYSVNYDSSVKLDENILFNTKEELLKTL